MVDYDNNYKVQLFIQLDVHITITLYSYSLTIKYINWLLYIYGKTYIIIACTLMMG